MKIETIRKKLSEYKGMRLEALAIEVGVHSNTLRRIRDGQDIKLNLLGRLENAMKEVRP